MAITARFYVNNVLTNGFQIGVVASPASLFPLQAQTDGNGYTWQRVASGETVTGYTADGSAGAGTISIPYSFGMVAFVQFPNSTPTVTAAYPSVLGIPISVDPQPYLYIGLIADPIEVRFFFSKVQIKIQQHDGVSATATQNRWTGLLGFEGDGSNSGRTIGVTHGVKDTRPYALTDSTGVVTFYICYGYAYYYASAWKIIWPAIPGHDWYDPSTLTTPERGRQNVQLQMLSMGHALFGLYGKNPTEAIPGGYFIGQLLPGTGDDGGYGLSIDYRTAWNPTTGILTTPNPSLITFNPPSIAGDNSPANYTDASPPTGYRSYLDVTLQDATGAAVSGATVSFGGGAYTGTTDANGRAVIRCKPKGSFVKPFGTGIGDQTAVTQFPLVDASSFPASATADQNPPQVKRLKTSVWSATVPYTGKSGSTLTGVAAGFLNQQFYGGEMMTLPYTDLTITKAAQTYVPQSRPDASGTVYIFEDETTVLNFRLNPSAGTGPGGNDAMDAATDPFGEPFLADAQAAGLKEYREISLGDSFETITAVSSKAQSPSRVAYPDMRHAVVYIDPADSGLKVYVTGNLWGSAPTPTTIAAGTFAACAARLDPDNASVHVWAVDTVGAVTHYLSNDGLGTWTSSPISGLPAGRAERGDVRFIGDKWVRAHPSGAAGATLYESRDGENWTSLGAIASTGTNPWLVALWTRELICLTLDGANVVSRRGGADANETWTWGSAVTVGAAPSGSTGPAGYATGTKLVCALRSGSQSPTYFVSRDQGDTWASGASG